jgi:uncharacterized repeat protein (TIGR01451 family)
MTSPLPNISISVPNYILINEFFDITVNFWNGSPSLGDIGFVPAYDLIITREIEISELGTPLAVWNGTSWMNPISNGLLWDSGLTQISFYQEYPTCPLPSGTFAINSKLYNVQLPYSSYGPEQPVLIKSYKTIYKSGYNNIKNIIPQQQIISRSMFFLGVNAFVVPNSHIFSSTFMINIDANQYSAKKTHDGIVGDKQPTGPSYPITYKIDVHVAPKQTFVELIIEDKLDKSLRLYQNQNITIINANPMTQVLTTTPSLNQYYLTDNTDPNNHKIVFNFGNIEGDSVVGTDISIIFQVYVDYYNIGTLDYVIGPTSNCSSYPDTIIIKNSFDIYNNGFNNGILNRLETQNDELKAGPIAINKTNLSIPQNFNDLIEYNITIFISDYFAYNTIIVDDYISGGQEYINSNNILYGSYVPTYSINGSFPINLTLSQSVDSGNVPYTGSIPFDKFNKIIFFIPDNVNNNIYNNSHMGSIYNYETTNVIPPSIIDPIQYQETGPGQNLMYTIKIKYYTLFKSTYEPIHGDINIENLGVIKNDVSLEGKSVCIFNPQKTGINKAFSSVEIKLLEPQIKKEIYAYNGILTSVTARPTYMKPGDIVAYLSKITLPIQNITSISWCDYLPPPLIKVNNYETNYIDGQTFMTNSIFSGSLNIPWKIGFLNVVILNNGFPLKSFLTIKNDQNAIQLDFDPINDTINSDINKPYKSINIEIIYTVEIGLEPFKNGLQFVNQSNLKIKNNLGEERKYFDIDKFTIVEPRLDIKKSLVTSNTQMENIFGSAGSISIPNINNSNFFTNFIPYTNAVNITQNQLIRYAVLVSNIGGFIQDNEKIGGSAYNVKIKDIYSQYLSFSSMQVYKYNSVSNNVSQLTINVDYNVMPLPNYNIEISILSATNNTFPESVILEIQNMYIFVMDLQLGNGIPPCSNITNTCSIESYYNHYNPSNLTTDNFVNNVYTHNPVNVNFSLVPVTISNVTFTTLSETINDNTGGYSPSEIIQGEFTVTYPMYLTDNINLTLLPNINLNNIILSYPNMGLVVISGMVINSPSWLHQFVSVTSSPGNVIYQFIFKINENTPTGDYPMDISLNADGCIYKKNQNVKVVRSTLNMEVCYKISGFNQVIYTVKIKNNGPNILYNIQINANFTNFIVIASPPINSSNPYIVIQLLSSSDGIQTFTIVTEYNIGSFIPMGTPISYNFSSNYIFYPDLSAPAILGPSVSNNNVPPTYNVPLVLNPNVTNLTYDHNLDILSTTRGIVGAIGDTMNYNIIIGALSNIKYNNITLDFGTFPNLYTIINLLLIPNTANVTNSSGIPLLYNLQTLNVVINNNKIIITFPTDFEINGLNSFTETYTINLPIKINNHIYNQSGIQYNPIITFMGKYMDSIFTIEPNSGSYGNCENTNFSPIKIFTIVEPSITITKTFTGFTNSNTLNYKIKISNDSYNVNTNKWVSSAFQMELIDDSFISPLFTSVVVNSIPVGWTSQISGLIMNCFMGLTEKLKQGSFVELFFSSIYNQNYPLLPQTFTNTAYTKFKSLQSQDNNARDGSDENYLNSSSPLNNYYRNASTSVLLETAKITKKTVTSGIISYGSIIKYALIITLPMGNNLNVVIDDVFNTNVFYNILTFQSATIVTTVAQSLGLLNNNFNGNISSLVPIIYPPNNIRFGIQNVVVNGNGTTSDNSFVIFYEVLVTSNLIDINGSIINTASLSYGTVSQGSVTPGSEITSSSSEIKILKPELNIVKSLCSNTENIIAGQPVCYEININHTNKSTFDAYYVKIQDNLTFGTIVSGSIQITSSCGSTTFTNLSLPNYLNIIIPIIHLNCEIKIKYMMLINPNITSGQYTNTVNVTYNITDDPNSITINANDNETIILKPSKIEINKEVDCCYSNIKSGGIIIWKITYSNTGNVFSNPPIIIKEDTTVFPNWLVPDYQKNIDNNWSENNGIYTYSDNIGLYPNSSSTPINFYSKINQNLQQGLYTYNNIASSGDILSNESNINFSVGPPIFNVKKYLDCGVSQLVSGGIIQWNIIYSNTGESPIIPPMIITEPSIGTLPLWMQVLNTGIWTETSVGSRIYTYQDNVSLLPNQTKNILFIVKIDNNLNPGIYNYTNNVLFGTEQQPNIVTSPIPSPISVIIGEPIITVDKKLITDHLIQGGTIEWEISYTNNSISSITNITITEPPLPQWLLFDSDPLVWVPQINGSYIYTDSLPLLPKNTKKIFFQAKIKNNLNNDTYIYDNFATLKSTEVNEITVHDQIDFTLGPPIIQIIKTTSTEEFLMVPGNIINWIIVYTNMGETSAHNIIITETIPPWGTLYDPFNIWTFSLPNICTFTESVLSPGSIRTIMFSVKINNNLQPGYFETVNVVKISADTFDKDSVGTPLPIVTSENKIKFTIGPPIIKISKKSVCCENSLKPGGKIVWKISYKNEGQSSAYNVKIIETVPIGLIFSQTQTYFWIPNNNEYIYTISILQPGESGFVTIYFDLPSIMNSGTYIYNNTVILNGFSDPGNLSPLDPVNSSDTENVTISSPIMTINKNFVPGQSSLKTNGVIVWEIVYKNIGDTPIYDILFDDIVTGQINGINSLSSSGWSENLGIFTFSNVNYDILNPGETKSIILAVNISSVLNPGQHVYVNNVGLRSNTTYGLDKDNEKIYLLENASNTVYLYIGPISALTSKSVNNSTPKINEIIKWTINIYNDDQDTMANVLIEEPILPTWLSYESLTNQLLGWQGLGPYILNVGPILPLSTFSVDFFVKIISYPVQSSYYTNNAKITWNNNMIEYATNTINVIKYFPDPYIYKSTNTNTPKIGDVITWQILYGNKGNSPSFVTKITENIPSWMSLIGPIFNNQTNGWEDIGNGIYQYVDNIVLGPGEYRIINFITKIISVPPQNPLEYINTVSLGMFDEDNIFYGPVSFNSPLYIDLKPPEITITKKICQNRLFYPNEIISWIINIQNNGDMIANNIVITEQPLPHYLQSINNNCWIQYLDNSYIYVLDKLLPQESKQINFNAKILNECSSQDTKSYVNIIKANYEYNNGNEIIIVPLMIISDQVVIKYLSNICINKKIIYKKRDNNICGCWNIFLCEITISNNGNTNLCGPITLYANYDCKINLLDCDINKKWKLNNKYENMSYQLLKHNYSFIPPGGIKKITIKICVNSCDDNLQLELHNGSSHKKPKCVPITITTLY